MMDYKGAFGSFSVDDLGKARKFYGEVLGLKIEEEKEMGLRLKLEGGAEVFVYSKDNHEPATFTILNFLVVDIEGVVEGLKSKGVEFESYDGGMLKTDEKNIARGKQSGNGPDIAWFKDPAGNFLAVIEE